MAKILKPSELLEIVRSAVEKDEIDDHDTYRRFVESLGELVTDYFGGEVGVVQWEDGAQDFLVPIHGNDSVPEGGGVYARYDKDGEL